MVTILTIIHLSEAPNPKVCPPTLIPPQTWNLTQCIKMVKSDKNHPHPRSFWHERAALQQSAFGQSTAGNDIVATILISPFLFSSPFFSPFPLSRPFLIEGVLGSKTYFVNVAWSAQKPRGRHLSRPRRPFLGPWQPFWILQAVRHCRW